MEAGRSGRRRKRKKEEEAGRGGGGRIREKIRKNTMKKEDDVE